MARTTPRGARPAREPLADDVAKAVQSVRRIVRALRLAARRVEAGAGISAAQLFALGQLVDEPAASLSELAERTMTDRSSVSVIVERLAERGLVARERAAEDRRRETIRITARGRALVQRLPAAPMAALIDALRALPAAERATTSRALARLADAMGLGAAPAPLLFEDEPVRARSARKSR